MATKQYRILFLGGPWSGLTQEADRLGEVYCNYHRETRQIGLYQRDKPGSTRYYYDAQRSALAMQKHDSFVAKIAGLLRPVEMSEAPRKGKGAEEASNGEVKHGTQSTDGEVRRRRTDSGDGGEDGGAGRRPADG